MKLDLQWPHAVVFSVSALVLGALVYTGKINAEVLGVLVTWLVPSPLAKKDGDK